MLEVNKLSKAYGGRVLFRDADLFIGRGDRIGLVGPNGVGKTTLLRILVGEEHADDGQINRQKGLELGYLPQDVLRIPDATVLEHTLAIATDLLGLGKEIEELEQRLADATSSDEITALTERHHELAERFHLLDGHTLEGRAKIILAGLGFKQADLDKPLAALSGGYGMRVELARILLRRPDVLLLDEPTNHLDLKSLLWLEDFLADYPGAWLVVSHDRYFLNRMVTSVAELTAQGIYAFSGNYDDYLEARAELEEQFVREQASLERRMAETRAFVERFRAKATKARQAQSRAKLLTRLEKQLAQKEAPPQRSHKKLRLELPEPTRGGEITARLTGIEKRYGELVVYRGLDLSLRRGERVALVGDNGAGKSTLLKILAGALPPDAGERQLGHNVETYYFAQHQAESLDLSHTVLQEMRALLPLETETRVRGLLGAFLFSGDAVEKYISVLSGGEKSRLALAKMLARPGNFLLLDEPTNHLDLDSRDVVEEALASFSGTVCFISHDRYFINRVATRVIEIRPGGVVRDFPGDYDYYLWKSAQLEAEGDGAAASAEAVSGQSKGGDDAKQARIAEREEKKAAQREASKRAKEITRLESAIAETEARLRGIDESMCDPQVYADAARCRGLTLERQELESRLQSLYDDWAEAAG